MSSACSSINMTMPSQLTRPNPLPCVSRTMPLACFKLGCSLSEKSQRERQASSLKVGSARRYGQRRAVGERRQFGRSAAAQPQQEGLTGSGVPSLPSQSRLPAPAGREASACGASVGRDGCRAGPHYISGLGHLDPGPGQCNRTVGFLVCFLECVAASSS
jgi:hypothetical protein